MSYTCPKCGRTSYHPEDERQGYCGACHEFTAEIEWVDTSPEFGAAMPHGSCNASFAGVLCGFPRYLDGTCVAGHPAQPEETS